jgi:DNA replication protein DnaC
MELGRPPRHERPRKRSTLKPARESGLGGVSGTVEESRPCSRCGVDVELRVSGEMPALMARVIAAQLAGAAPVLCDGCVAVVEREEQQAAARERHEAVLVTRRRAAALPPKWEAQGFDGLEADGPRARSLELAQAWSRAEFPGLLLWGREGRGKTAIAAAAANARIERSPVRWLSVGALLLGLRMPFDSPEYVRAMRKLEATGSKAALVLDDLDKTRPTEQAVQPLYVAVNAWIEAELPLLVTLNRDLDELAAWLPETFGAVLASRLSGYCRVIEVAGRDRRIEP